MRDNDIVFKGKTEAIYKIIVVGDPDVGKSELIAKFATNQFEEKYLPTIGVSILKEPIELKDVDVTVNLMFWDIAGQPQFYKLHRPYFNGADGMFLVFDITRSSTFSNINNWYSAAVKYGLSGIPKILIGNKAHLTEERKIILPMAEHLAEKLNASYYETSTLNGVNFKEAFEKIALLVYRSKELNYTGKKKPLIFKSYGGPTQPSSSVSHSTKKGNDITSDSLFLLRKKSSSEMDNRGEKALETGSGDFNGAKKRKSQTLNLPIKLSKREKRALKTTFRYFNESKAAYFKPEKAQTVLLNAIETGDLVVLTNKLKFRKVISLFSGFFYILIIGGILIGMIPGMRNFFTILSIVLIGFIIRAITIAMYGRHYFIVLDSHGIYYKKIRGPRFIPWTEVVEIIGYLDFHYFPGVHKNERTVGLGLKSKKLVRFNAMNYNFEHKFFEFEEAFITFKFRQCNFYRYGLLAHKSRVKIFKPYSQIFL